MVHKKCILVFLKNPERGMVKSRLVGDVDRLEDLSALVDYFTMTLP